MKIVGLDGKAHKLTLGDEVRSMRGKSILHVLARGVIKKVFPTMKLCEEVHMPGCKTPMYLDFFIPLSKIAIEVQGQQHYKFVGHFHKDKSAFYAGKRRDMDKKTWCGLNDVVLIEFPYNETEEQWEERLRNVYGT